MFPHLLYKESPAAAGAIKRRLPVSAGAGAGAGITPAMVTAEASNPFGRFSFADCRFNVSASKRSTGVYFLPGCLSCCSSAGVCTSPAMRVSHQVVW